MGPDSTKTRSSLHFILKKYMKIHVLCWAQVQCFKEQTETLCSQGSPQPKTKSIPKWQENTAALPHLISGIFLGRQLATFGVPVMWSEHRNAGKTTCVWVEGGGFSSPSSAPKKPLTCFPELREDSRGGIFMCSIRRVWKHEVNQDLPTAQTPCWKESQPLFISPRLELVGCGGGKAYPS